MAFTDSNSERLRHPHQDPSLSESSMDSEDLLSEAPREEQQRGSHWPRMTGYRLLTLLLTAGFGLSKAKLSYEGYSTAPNTLDWLYGVVAFLMWVLVNLLLPKFFDLECPFSIFADCIG